MLFNEFTAGMLAQGIPDMLGQVPIIRTDFIINGVPLKNQLNAEIIGRGGTWLDTGSIKNFINTSNFISAIEDRQGLKIGCIEEIALNNNWITKNHIKKSIKFYGNCEYSNYLKKLI